MTSSEKTIGFRLLRYVFGCYFIVTVAVTTVQILYQYTLAKEGMFKELANLGETIERSLAISMWAYNLEQAESILLGINKVDDVFATKVTNTEMEILVNNGAPDESYEGYQKVKEFDGFGKGTFYRVTYIKDDKPEVLFEYELPIRYTDHRNNDIIGSCYIYLKQNTVINNVKYEILIIIVNSIIKTLALWIIFLFFTKRIIANPLSLLAKASKDLDPNDPKASYDDEPLKKISTSGNNDELHILASCFLKMRKSVIDKINIIEMQNATLEERVKERTNTIEDINRELRHLSLHDPLTGLPNRVLFRDRLEQLLLTSKRENTNFVIASIDLRKFKEVNDTYGHLAGDILLKEIASRMSKSVRKYDTISRMGGDEFAILFPWLKEDNAEIMAKKILNCCNEPIAIEDQNLFVGMNVGMSIYPDHGEEADLLFKNADMAMYEAKKNDNRFALFSPDIHNKIIRQDVIEKDLLGSHIFNQLEVFYQPIVKRENFEIYSIEALIRWQHPEFGLILPEEFIPIAERSNFISTLTEWIVATSLADCKGFIDNGLKTNISINISGRLLHDSLIADKLNKKIQEQTIPAEHITFEFTETTTMNHPKKSIEVLNQLKDIGVNLSIDDFGKGYSSFSYLTRLPVDELKIDRSFLNDPSENNKLVIESIVEIAHRLRLKVVAVGVENKETLENLEELSCDYIQGNYFFPAAPVNELLKHIKSHKKSLNSN